VFLPSALLQAISSKRTNQRGSLNCVVCGSDGSGGGGGGDGMGWDAACESSGREPELISFARGGPSVTPDAGDVDLKERKEEECFLPSRSRRGWRVL